MAVFFERFIFLNWNIIFWETLVHELYHYTWIACTQKILRYSSIIVHVYKKDNYVYHISSFISIYYKIYLNILYNSVRTIIFTILHTHNKNFSSLSNIKYMSYETTAILRLMIRMIKYQMNAVDWGMKVRSQNL